MLPNPSGRNLSFSLTAFVSAYSALRVSRANLFEQGGLS
jgi:hypothetical protein